MLQQSYKKYEPVPWAISFVILLSFLGVIGTAVQAGLIVLSGDILCLNDGCEIVESLTRVPPLVFNLAGCLYFLILLCCFYNGRNGSKFWLKSGRLLLTAGLAAEGVLVSFQHYIAQVFCSYCLIILGTIVLLNLFVGLRQLFVGLVMFASVVLAFSALEFTPATQADKTDLTDGTYARLHRETADDRLFLFFSATCPHCEDVIATIDESFTCSVNFNPVSEVESIGVAGSVLSGSYSPEINKSFLKNLGISEIPVLMVKSENEVAVRKGKSTILSYLEDNCYPKAGENLSAPVPSDYGQNEMSVQTTSDVSSYYSQPEPVQDESCGVEVDCDPLEQGEDAQQ
ncbi:hypothetical protein [Desulfopila sp. IMCC35008]|uniref:hypothetical protein n=1 Tax=Desulfopila sp. IMCC35008 TaxID=2653858 RepID=UPI0013CF4047|nr:hypothetical protein [Desulfopila sp. IMCC35008]